MVVQGMKKVCGRIVIGIGSAEATPDADNPFTLEERHEMISSALLEADIPDASILDIPDHESDDEWVTHALKICGPIDSVWTGNELVASLFAGKGIKVQKIKEVPGVSATLVRERMHDGGAWQELVPDAVAGVLGRLKAVERVKHLSG